MNQTVKPSAMEGLFFPLSAREEREDSSLWEVKGHPWEAARAVDGLGGGFVQLTKGTPSSSRGQHVKYSLSFLASYLSFTCRIFDKYPII